MESVIDYQAVSDAFQKEWLEHPLILTADDPPRVDRKGDAEKTLI